MRILLKKKIVDSYLINYNLLISKFVEYKSLSVGKIAGYFWYFLSLNVRKFRFQNFQNEIDKSDDYRRKQIDPRGEVDNRLFDFQMKNEREDWKGWGIVGS